MDTKSIKIATIVTSLLLAFLLLALTFRAVSASTEKVRDECPLPHTSLAPAQAPLASPLPQATPAMTATLRAASRRTILFYPNNTYSEALKADLPHLVLYRDATLTDPSERTLIISVTDIIVPPEGVTVTILIQTQHGNPGAGGPGAPPIKVWEKSRRINNIWGITLTHSISFAHEFTDTAVTAAGTITSTPTDYFQYAIKINNTLPLAIPFQDHAFLMENEFRSDLNADYDVLVRYYDMAPFGYNGVFADWVRRRDVPVYIRASLIPMVRDVFETEVVDWDLPGGLNANWRNGSNELTVDINDPDTWFHGTAGSNSSIHLTSFPGGWEGYGSALERHEATFAHEFFHNIQTSISYAATGRDVWFWNPFGEGTAVLATAVRQPALQFASPGNPGRQYPAFSGLFLSDFMNFSYAGGKYPHYFHYAMALYWRFLYEQCGGITAGGAESPARGMAVIWRALEEMYKEAANDADSNNPPSIVENIESVMDTALTACPAFSTYRESLLAFAQANYSLLFDANHSKYHEPYGEVYPDPPLEYSRNYGGTALTLTEQITVSFGMDFIDVGLASGANGLPLTLAFYGNPGADAEFDVQL